MQTSSRGSPTYILQLKPKGATLEDGLLLCGGTELQSVMCGPPEHLAGGFLLALSPSKWGPCFEPNFLHL